MRHAAGRAEDLKIQIRMARSFLGLEQMPLGRFSIGRLSLVYKFLWEKVQAEKERRKFQID